MTDRTSNLRNADDAARSSEYWKAELLAANAIIERQQAEIERLRDGLREARLETARTAAEGLRAIGSAVETTREPPRELLESIAWDHKDTNKFERAREQLQAWLRSSPKTSDHSFDANGSPV